MRRRTGTIEARTNGFRIRYTDLNGIRQSEHYDTREAAEFHLAQRLAELSAGVPVTSRANTVTFKELAADVITDYELNGYTSIDHAKDRFRVHLLPVFGRMKAARITTAQIKAYQVARLKEGAQPGTVNREIELMRRTFSLAIAGKRLFTKPFIPRLRENNVRTGFFTREEVERLASHLKPPLDSFVRFGFLTGWRLGEIKNLRWSNVDFARNEIRLDVGTTKNRDGRVFPMTVELRRLLEAIRQAGNTEDAESRLSDMTVRRMPTSTQLVFRWHGRRVGNFIKSWTKANHLAGLPCIYGTDKKVIRAVRIFHDLRRSAAREMAIQGIPQHIIQKLMGHRSASMFQRYAIVGEADLRNAVELLDRLNVPAIVPKERKGN